MEQPNMDRAPQTNDSAEFDGDCAFALSVGKSGVRGSNAHCLVDGDKTYYFSNGVALFLWKVLPNRQKKATATWAAQ